MPSSSIITILSLVVLCTLSFTVVFGSHNIFDTLARDTLAHDSPFSLPKSNIVHKRRAVHHARATTPVPASESNPPQSNPIPSQSAPANTQASSPPPVSSPSPSAPQPSQSQDNSSPAPSASRAISTSPTSAAAASASASASAAASPSSASPLSSSSNAQASSLPGVTSSSVGAASNIANNPTTTFLNKPVSYTSGLSGSRPTNPGSTVSLGATPSAGAGSGFFKNKAAVGATFSIIGIIGGLAVIMAVLTIMRRRRRRARIVIEDEEFFEKYPSVDEPVPQLPPGFGSGSAAPSFTDVNMDAAPAGAYPDRAVHYGQSNAGAVLNPVDYGIAYPPGAANNNGSTPAIKNGDTYEDTASEYSVPSAVSHPFADPANTSGPTAAPPVPYRPIQGRVQEMVTTDSYYGSNSAGVGTSGMGYAQ